MAVIFAKKSRITLEAFTSLFVNTFGSPMVAPSIGLLMHAFDGTAAWVVHTFEGGIPFKGDGGGAGDAGFAGDALGGRGLQNYSVIFKSKNQRSL